MSASNASSRACACCSSLNPPCGIPTMSGSGASSGRNSEMSPVAYAIAGSSGGTSASARKARISSSVSVIGSIAVTNGLDVNVSVMN